MGELSPWHLLIVVGVFVMLFGAKRLPDAARSLGQSLRIFKSETKALSSDGQPATPAVAAPAVAAQPLAAPVAAQPVAAQPVAAQPVAVQPVAVQPVAVEHALAEPVRADQA